MLHFTAAVGKSLTSAIKRVCNANDDDQQDPTTYVQYFSYGS